MILKQNQRIVFIGDSITDGGRKYPIGEGLWDAAGSGFVRMVDTFLAVDYPELNIRVTNMGVSGNTSYDLLDRWEHDVSDLNPDIVVMCIGVNDVWRQFDSPASPDWAVTPKRFEINLNEMADLTKAHMLWLTPYFLEVNLSDPMRARMDEYRAIMKKVAAERGIDCIDLQNEFDTYLQKRHSSFISWDRVHPGWVGSLIISRAVLKYLAQ